MAVSYASVNTTCGLSSADWAHSEFALNSTEANHQKQSYHVLAPS